MMSYSFGLQHKMDDFSNIVKLKEEQRKAILDCENRLATWEKFKSDYESLENTLKTLPEKVSHEVMVPFGSLAFMPGKLIHTNEILVLLGDNWFAERSASQAAEIVHRRQEYVTENIKGIKADLEGFASQLRVSHELENITKGESGIVEIKEELTEEDAKEVKSKGKRTAHAKAQQFRPRHVEGLRMTRHVSRNPSTSKKPMSTEDKALFAKLDKLEAKESENNKLENLSEESVEEKPEELLENTKKEDGVRWQKKQESNRYVITAKESKEKERTIRFKELDSDDDDDDDYDYDSDTDEEVGKCKIPVIFSHTSISLQPKASSYNGTQHPIKSPADIYISTKARSILKTPSVDKEDEVNTAAESDSAGMLFDPVKAFTGEVVERTESMDSRKVATAAKAFTGEIVERTESMDSRKAATSLKALSCQTVKKTPDTVQALSGQIAEKTPDMVQEPPAAPKRMSKFKAGRRTKN